MVDEIVNLKSKSTHFFELMSLLRISETVLAERYADQEMRTPTHFGIGQEAIAAGVCSQLQKGDSVFSHHRAHNHYLACGGGLYELAAELYGTKDGCSGGWGGSVHITSMDNGFIGSSAILGQSASLATGAALSHKLDKNNAVSVAFFGDAALEEGTLYESFNFASVWQLPVLFVCENNNLSTESGPEVRQPAGTKLSDRAKSFGIHAMVGNGNDILEVCKIANEAFERIKTVGGPVFVELETYRWLEHVGPNFDPEGSIPFRSNVDQLKGQKKCPLVREENRLLKHKLATEIRIGEIKNKTEQFVRSEIERARMGEKPSIDKLYSLP
jgi:pyruvate dehydrogenase E1 component alpha subunit